MNNIRLKLGCLVVRIEVNRMNNIRLKLGCLVVSLGVRLMPKEWRSKKAINNLIAVNWIKNVNHHHDRG